MKTGADLGLAFDGDADRCFVVDERGEIVSPSVLTALIAVRELGREPGATIIHNLITSRAVPEIVTEHGGVPVRTRVGHSFIKAQMAQTGAIFGGEHSGHFYFRDFWFADSGMLAALHVLAAVGSTSQAAVRAAGRVLPVRGLGGDQQRGQRPGRRHGEGAGRVRQPARLQHRRAGRAHGDRPGLLVQRAAVQHRAAAPAERRGAPMRPPWLRSGDEVLGIVRVTARERINGGPVQIDEWLLDILACPKCHSPLRADPAADELICTGAGLRPGLPGAR